MVPVPCAATALDAPFALAVNNIGHDPYLGPLVTGKIEGGSVGAVDSVVNLQRETGTRSAPAKLSEVLITRGTTKQPLGLRAGAGDIVTLAGIAGEGHGLACRSATAPSTPRIWHRSNAFSAPNARHAPSPPLPPPNPATWAHCLCPLPDDPRSSVKLPGAVGDTITSTSGGLEEPLVTPPLATPTLAMTFGANDGPLRGKEGDKLTGSVLKTRLYKETENNVTIRAEKCVTDGEKTDIFCRGELQLGILIETLRREGFEFCVSPPRVLMGEDEHGNV